MNPIRELAQAYADTYKLEKRYYVLTSVVGVAGVLVGVVLLLGVAIILSKVFGVELNKPIREEVNGYFWFGAFLVSIPIAIYLGVVCVAGLFSAVMVSLGKFTRKEAVRYALLSQYPQSWFRKE